MPKATNSAGSRRKLSASSTPEPSPGRRLIESLAELRAHLRGEKKLGETAYHAPPETDVRALRDRLALSQSDFAALFGFSVHSVQDWEQGRRRPEASIRAYLALIQRDPQAVVRALRAA